MTAENIDYSDIGTGKRISIEPGTPLQIEIGGIAFRFKSILVGMVPDEFLIMKTPIIPGDAPFGSIEH